MTDHGELVKALRCCGNEGCHKCPYQKHIHEKFCWVIAMKDAADAIEALQDTVQAQDKALKECARQLAKTGPKRGETAQSDIAKAEWYEAYVMEHLPMNEMLRSEKFIQSIRIGQRCKEYDKFEPEAET